MNFYYTQFKLIPHRLALPVVLAFLFLFFGYLMIAQAQESCPDISVQSGNWLASPSNIYATGSAGGPPYINFANNTAGYYQINLGNVKATQIQFGSHCTVFAGDCTQSGNLTLVVRYLDGSATTFTMNTGGDYGIETHEINPAKTIDYIRISRNSVNQEHRMSGFALVGCTASDGGDGSDLCPLVLNGHFAAADGWLLDGGAVISPTGDLHTLDLPAGGIAAQNLTLESNKTYNAVISATLGAGSLNVGLGTFSETLDIAEPGLYTATFSMPELAGPVLYSLENSGSAELALDFACVSSATGDGVQPDCIAPENGTFDTAAGWQWYRNAAWEQVSQKAALPYNDGSDGDMSLIVAGRAYTMPAVPAGQYLILGYQAQASSEAGLVSSKVGTAEAEQKVYKTPYDYEIDISTQAGQTVDLALADSGTSDILLDNVCVFLSTTPPQLPTPSDPGGISGMDFGFNYTCTDVPALLAGWGINVYSAQAIYEAGVSVWEPQYYIPWLAAALWSNAGRPISCFLVEQMRLLAGVTQQQINMFLNYVNWSMRSSNLAAPWLQQGVFYLRTAIFSPATAARTTAYGWLNWSVRSVRAVLDSVGENWEITVAWIREAAVYLSESSFGSGEQLIDNLPGGGTMFGFIDLLWAMATLMWALWSWIWNNVFVLVDIPIKFYYAFNDGVQTEAFSSLMSCSGTNFWCGLLAGAQIVNQTIGHTVLYPIVIMLIIMGTLTIFWKHIWQLVHLDIR